MRHVEKRIVELADDVRKAHEKLHNVICDFYGTNHTLFKACNAVDRSLMDLFDALTISINQEK